MNLKNKYIYKIFRFFNSLQGTFLKWVILLCEDIAPQAVTLEWK